jgi:hypothetical protein
VTGNVVRTCAFGLIDGPLQAQAGEGYLVLAGWSACSRWRFLSVYPWERHVSRVCRMYYFIGLALHVDGSGGGKPRPYGLQVPAFGFDDICDARYEYV